MKFLVLSEMAHLPPVPPEQIFEMAVRQVQWNIQLEEEGKVEVGYAKAGAKGGVLIFDVESAAELNSLLSRMPLYTFLNIQIFPLIPNKEILAQLEKQAKMKK